MHRPGAVGADFSTGMLAEARFAYATAPHPAPHWVRGDAHALPFRDGTFDLVASFGAFGHFLPAERPHLFGQVHRVLRAGGTFAFPMAAPPRPGTAAYWSLLGFDAAMRVRNTVWRPPFVMYYRTWPLGDVRRDLEAAGFDVTLEPLAELGRRDDGAPAAGWSWPESAERLPAPRGPAQQHAADRDQRREAALGHGRGPHRTDTGQHRARGTLCGDVAVLLRRAEQPAAHPQGGRRRHEPEGRRPVAALGHGVDHTTAGQLRQRLPVDHRTDGTVAGRDGLEETSR